jgi:hypothetical protein
MHRSITLDASYLDSLGRLISKQPAASSPAGAGEVESYSCTSPCSTHLGESDFVFMAPRPIASVGGTPEFNGLQKKVNHSPIDPSTGCLLLTYHMFLPCQVTRNGRVLLCLLSMDGARPVKARACGALDPTLCTAAAS